MENEKLYEVIVEESVKKVGRFPWTKAFINIMLDLYEKRIDLFMNPYKHQGSVWAKLVEDMKAQIPEIDRNRLTVSKVTSKFNDLKKRFKKEYFSIEKEETEHLTFPYYEKMNKMFTDYAMKKLNETNSLEETTDEELSSMIMQVLEGSLIDTDENDHQYTNSSHNKSEASKLKFKLSELPDESLCVQQKKMRIDPNTPFNRNISHKSIINQKNSLLHSYHVTTLSKRRLDDDPDFRPKTKKINSTDVYDDSRNNYIVEALDECELSNIPIRHSKALYQDQNSSRFSRTSYNVTQNENKTCNQSAEKFEVIYQDTLEESSHSVVHIPPLNATSDYESDESYVNGALRNNSNETIRGNKPVIVPKKLNLLREVQNLSTSIDSTLNSTLIEKLRNNPEISFKYNENSSPPIWFKNFMLKYEQDMKSINDKLDHIISTGNSTSTSPVFVHQSTQLKFRKS